MVYHRHATRLHKRDVGLILVGNLAYLFHLYTVLIREWSGRSEVKSRK